VRDKVSSSATKTLLSAAATLMLVALNQVNSTRAQTAAADGEMNRPASQHTAHQRKEPAPGTEAASNAGAFGSSVPDFILVNQDGRRVRLYTDLMKGKVVVLSFFYTTCTFVCDAQGRNLAKLQARLGGRLGKEVFLISVTRDPATDTPARLRKWAKAHGVRDGWSLVTGDVKDVSSLVARFLSDTIGPVESHAATVYVGNEATASWLVSSGLSSPEELLGLIDRVSGRSGLSKRLPARQVEAGGAASTYEP
jgi:cytochrome oxidase Cu insertion factor (SCO1/SenC/PrrC family)